MPKRHPPPKPVTKHTPITPSAALGSLRHPIAKLNTRRGQLQAIAAVAIKQQEVP